MRALGPWTGRLCAYRQSYCGLGPMTESSVYNVKMGWLDTGGHGAPRPAPGQSTRFCYVEVPQPKPTSRYMRKSSCHDTVGKCAFGPLCLLSLRLTPCRQSTGLGPAKGFTNSILSCGQVHYLGELMRLCAPAATACRLAQAFFSLVRDRDAAALDGWLAEATQSDLPEMGGFAGRVRRDRAAVDAGLTLDWSQGQTEGFVNKLKRLKRHMFGRAGIDLLRERMLDGG